MQHALPDDPSSLSKWQKRVGAERLEKLLEATLHTALAMKAVRPQEFQQVNVDTTVSGRRRGCPRRPPTPPDERFRIRRFLWKMPIG
jgi:hypothetical protein